MDSSGTAKLAANLRAIRKRIATATQAAGRATGSVRLIAVSKTRPQSDVLDAMADGQAIFGENRVQEAVGKFGDLRTAHRFKLHLIGGIQTNKALDAVMVADTIETLDRPSIADAVARAADKAGRLPELLVQVNVGREARKSGIAPESANEFIEHCLAQFGDRLCGLMCVPPVGDNPQPYFQALAALAGRHGLSELSMGMSGDFELAIACGATMVRIGSALFGQRVSVEI